MKRIVLLLLKYLILRKTRENLIFQFFFKNHLSAHKTVQLYFSTIILYFGLTSILPLFIYGSSEILLNSLRSLAPSYHFIINGIMVLYMFFGSFISANLIYSLNLYENEYYLSLPIVMDDLVQFRISDCVIMVSKFFLYFISPLLIFVLLSMSWPVYWILMIFALVGLLAIIAFLIGVVIMLAICKLFPNHTPDKIFITCFLTTMFLLFCFIRLFQSGYIVQGFSSIQTWTGHLLAGNSISVWLQNMVTQPLGLIQYVLALLFVTMLVFYLWKLSFKSLYVMYYKIHVSADAVIKRKSSIRYGITFENLNKLLHFLPSFTRIIIIKDILALIRKPNLLIKILILIVTLIFFANLEYTYVSEPILFILYFSSIIVMSRLFIEAIGRERGNILNIKLLSPSISRYLSARVVIALSASSIILIPFWIVTIGMADNIMILNNFYRIIILILNMIFCAFLVTFYSASFAKFKSDNIENSDIGLNPVAMISFWGVGLLYSLFFYKLDLAIINGATDNISLLILFLMGIIILIFTPLCWYLGKRKIKNYF